MYYLPFQWRKLLLTACRVQADPYLNDTITTLIAELQVSVISVPFTPGGKEHPIDINDIISAFSEFYDDPFACTLCSYFVRAEGTAHRQEFLDVLEETIDKEISAAVFYESQFPNLDYRCLFTDAGENGVHPVITRFPVRSLALWKTHIRNIAFLQDNPSWILFPHYNGRKNIGISTSEALAIERGLPLADLSKTTTLDLLRHYHENGVQVRGPVEVRHAWKFNDLKPRTYYCLGGSAYWDSLYIKPICNYLVKAFPSTSPSTRYATSRIKTVSRDEVLLTYDYTSFTTSLGELKFFLDMLAWVLDDVELPVVDVREGIRFINLGDYIREYNQSVNIHQEFDLRRVSGNHRMSEIHYQGRSGSLGVGGNIVFSTLLHGISLSHLTDTPDEDSCVGDDALVKLLLTALPTFIDCIRKLGYIEESKFTTITRPTYDDDPLIIQRQQFKYLKRPLNLSHEGSVITGFLDMFPNLAPQFFPQGDGIHKVDPWFDTPLGLRTFCTQWGRFLTTTSVVYPFSSEDITEFILSSIRAVYRKFGLSEDGAIPGHRFFTIINKSRVYHRCDFFAPPCSDHSVFETRWTEHLLSTYCGESMIMTYRVGGGVPPPIDLSAGITFRCTMDSPLLSLLESLGYLEVHPIMSSETFNSAFLKRFEPLLFGLVTDEKILYDVRVLSDVPVWYSDVHMHVFPSESEIRPIQEVLEEITTIYSDE